MAQVAVKSLLILKNPDENRNNHTEISKTAYHVNYKREHAAVNKGLSTHLDDGKRGKGTGYFVSGLNKKHCFFNYIVFLPLQWWEYAAYKVSKW